ncbi:XdhC/CoxI family protein [Fulvimonas sp. R45]|uniref:XdhC family protein n=1 Tax=Fulvimonas sp. R45 TaxID=3045937 RepID=UPI00265F00CD|nr:XdhC/CoxI family protein [Fulvimonas sp. R45]
MSSAAEWRALIDAVGGLPEGAPTAALATLIRTRGSTFRHAGTRMLVHADGRVVCALSGGCPQRDIVERALSVIRDGKPLRVAYNDASGLDVLMEMGCGGELELLIEPVERTGALRWLAPLGVCLRERRPATLATWFARDGMVLAPRHALADGPGADAPTCDALRAALARPRPERATVAAIAGADGHDEVLLEPVQPPHALVVIGGNATSHALLRLAGTLGWQAVLVDNDPRRLDVSGLPTGTATRCAEPARLCEAVAFDPHTAVVVMTHGLERDTAYLRALEEVPLAYVGALSSRGRAVRLLDALEAPAWELRAPTGLDIGAGTPEEIALSIAAEILAVQRARAGGPLRARTGAVHA